MFIPAFSWHLVCTKFLSPHTALVFFDGCHVPFYFFHVQAKQLLGIICLFCNGLYPILTSIVHADCLSPSSFQPLSLLQKDLNANSPFPGLPFLTFQVLTHGPRKKRAILSRGKALCLQNSLLTVLEISPGARHIGKFLLIYWCSDTV